MSERKKPIKIEWQGSLAESAPDNGGTRVQIKSGQREPATPQPAAHGNAPLPQGTVKARRERQARGGHEVSVLFEFRGQHTGPDSLKTLCTYLKRKLACGGTAENQTIVIQSVDLKRLTHLLSEIGISLTAAGGYPAK